VPNQLHHRGEGNGSGLTAGSMVLQNSSGDNLSIMANGTFTFASAVQRGGAYAVTVLAQTARPGLCGERRFRNGDREYHEPYPWSCTPNPETTFLPLTAPTYQPGGAELRVVTSKSIARPPITVAQNFKTGLGFTLPLTRSTAGYQSAG